MRLSSIFTRHSWYSDRADAYADGELTSSDRTRFESHLIACEECQSNIATAHALRSALERVPEAPIPRSFRVTPQMVAETPKPTLKAPAPLYLGLARAGAALSVAAFAVVLVVGMIGSDSSANHSAQDTAGASAPFNTAPESAPLEKSAESVPTPQLAPATASGGVSGSALIPPSPAATPPDLSANGAATPALQDSDPVRATDTGPSADGSALTSIGPETVPNSDSQASDRTSSAMLITGIAAAIFVVALVSLETARRLRRA